MENREYMLYNLDMDNEERIAALEKEIATLKARVDDIFEALLFESSSTTEHLGKQGQDITELHEYLMSTIHHLFPKIADGYAEIAAVLRRRPPSCTKHS